MRGEGGDLLPRILAMVEEEGTTMMVGEGAINSHKDNSTNQNLKVQRGE